MFVLQLVVLLSHVLEFSQQVSDFDPILVGFCPQSGDSILLFGNCLDAIRLRLQAICGVDTALFLEARARLLAASRS